MRVYLGRKEASMVMVWRRNAAGSHDSGILIRDPLGRVSSNFWASGGWVGIWRNDTGAWTVGQALYFFDNRRLRQYHQLDGLIFSRLQ
jgi:hypothetical protein